MKTLRYIPLITIFILAFSYENSTARMYRCLESNGSVRYTDTLEHKNCRPMVFNNLETSYSRKTLRYSGKSRSIRHLSKKYDKLISYYGVRYNIDPHLIRAVIRTESAFNPRAVSKKGAQGLMQLMPDTARELRVADPFNPSDNIDGGCRYLRKLLNTFKQDVRLALAAYNCGPTVVKRERSVPRIPETVNYVKRVLKFYREYKNGAA